MPSAHNVNSNINNNTINNSITVSHVHRSAVDAFGSDERGTDGEDGWKGVNGRKDARDVREDANANDADANANANANVKASTLPKGSAAVEGPAEQTLPHAMNPLNLHLLSHPTRGRGVFAPCDIAAGTLLEESPVLLLSKEQWDEGRMNDTVLGEYGFCWSNGGMGIGLGLASLFNHSSSPNVNFIRNVPSSTIRFITSRSVAAGEELCICYSADETKLWFVKSDQASTSALPRQSDRSDIAAVTLLLANGHREPVRPEDPFPFLPNGGYSADNSDEEPLFPDTRMQMDGLELFAPEDASEQLERLKLREVRKAQIKAQERSSKEARRARWYAKHHRDPSSSTSGVSGAADGLAHPVPLHLDASRALLATSGADADEGSSRSSGSQTPGSGSESYNYDYAYPSVPPGLVHEGDLPPPLHSQTQTSLRDESGAPLVSDLDWAEGDWPDSRAIPEWGAAVRVKGLTEEREEERDQASTIEIWVAEVADPRLTRLILNFIKDSCTQDVNLRHLKRVARRPSPEGEDRAYIALCATYEVPSLSALRSMLGEYNTLLSELVPSIAHVPSTPARSLAQIKLKNLLWPVVYAPLPTRLDDDSTWTPARKSWVWTGLQRVIADALAAKAQGELPVATFVTSPPASFWPITDAFVPPTPDLRAAAHDTRTSEAHPLRHAAFNCIAQIAALRTRPPFCTISPTRNGADYLLTSLSLFITHEPCVMCAMALLHSRVREVFYIFPRERGGGFESAFGVHGRKDLNHRYDVWKYSGPLPPGTAEALYVDPSVAL